MPANYCLVLCTCPDAETAHRLAGELVADQRAACVNILPGITSVYGWEGRVEKASEHLLLVKTTADGFHELEVYIRERHPYDVPEIVAVPFIRGSRPYLDWMSAWLEEK